MRGRTNITQRKAPYINGDVIQATVDSSTIYTGDFVEYRTATAIEDASFSGNANNSRFIHHKDFMTNYLLVLNITTVGNNVYFEIWNKVSKLRVDRLSFPSTSGNVFFDIIGNEIILCFGYAGTYNVYCIAFENSHLVIKDSKSFTIDSNVFLGISKLDSSHFVILSTKYNVGNIITSVFGYSLNQIGELDEETVLSTSLINPPSGVYNEVLYLADKKVGFVLYGIGYGVVDFDILYSATLLQFNTSNIQGDIIKISNYSVIEVRSSSVAYLYYYNLINDEFSSYQFNPKILDSSSLNVFIIRLDDNLALLSSKKDHVVIYFDESTKEIYVSNILNIGIATDSLFLIKMAFIDSNENIKGYNMNVDNKVINASYSQSDNELSVGLDTNYVKPYAGGKAIGFAKTSGNVGNVVSIYVPHNS